MAPSADSLLSFLENLQFEPHRLEVLRAFSRPDLKAEALADLIDKDPAWSAFFADLARRILKNVESPSMHQIILSFGMTNTRNTLAAMILKMAFQHDFLEIVSSFEDRLPRWDEFIPHALQAEKALSQPGIESEDHSFSVGLFYDFFIEGLPEDLKEVHSECFKLGLRSSFFLRKLYRLLPELGAPRELEALALLHPIGILGSSLRHPKIKKSFTLARDRHVPRLLIDTLLLETTGERSGALAALLWRNFGYRDEWIPYLLHQFNPDPLKAISSSHHALGIVMELAQNLAWADPQCFDPSEKWLDLWFERMLRNREDLPQLARSQDPDYLKDSLRTLLKSV